MAKNFSDAIDEIIPFVEERDKDTPFIIMRNTGDAYLPWFVEYSYSEDAAKDALRECRESDPYAVKFTGADFNGGSFDFVYDKVLCARLRAEYDAEPFGMLHVGEFRALINAVEDNIGSFSQHTIDRLLWYDKPLRALYDINPVPLYDRDNPDGELYERDKVDEFVEAIEYRFNEIQSKQNDTWQSEIGADFSDAKVNKHDPTHVISSLLINGADIELGEDTTQVRSFYVESNRGGEVLFSMRTENYPEAVKTYAEQITGHVQAMSLDRDNAAFVRGAGSSKLTDDRCVPDSKNADYTGQLVILDAASLKKEYRDIFSQLVLCTHGSGARPNAIDRSVFGVELYSGESVVCDRSQILGVADESKLPKWVEVKLEMQREQGKTEYSHEKFYAASGDSQADIFKCVENGKLYIPCENELFRYNEPPVKEQAKAAPSKPAPPKPAKAASKTEERPQQKPSLLADLDASIKEAAQLAERKGGGHTKKRGDLEVD
ncbi:hypothetical protein FACS1894105_05020 [Clostridia bacterium]|nr:hypothetical protein FACS1894105_05020 [Clostridia bacterium]